MCQRTKEIGFHKSLVVVDPFKAHFADDVAAATLICHTGVVKVPAVCTSKVQRLDVCINKPFKSNLRECWQDHVVKVVKDAGDDANNNPTIPDKTFEINSSFYVN